MIGSFLSMVVSSWFEVVLKMLFFCISMRTSGGILLLFVPSWRAFCYLLFALLLRSYSGISIPSMWIMGLLASSMTCYLSWGEAACCVLLLLRECMCCKWLSPPTFSRSLFDITFKLWRGLYACECFFWWDFKGLTGVFTGLRPRITNPRWLVTSKLSPSG